MFENSQKNLIFSEIYSQHKNSLRDINISQNTYQFNMDSIIRCSAFDVDGITYGSVKTNDNGGKSIYMGYNGSPIIMQTPEMYAPFGMTKWENEKTGIPKYTIDLSFKDVQNRNVLKNFFDKMSEFDNKLINDGTANQFEWLKKKNMSIDTIKALYTPMIKYPIDKSTGEISDKYPPTFKFTIPFRDDKFTCEVYDENKNMINLSDVETKAAKITAIIQCVGIWSAAGKFGCSWKCLQMKVRTPQPIKGFAFQDDGEEIEDNKDSETTVSEDDPLDM